MQIDVTWLIHAPMRDGAALAVRIYRPAGDEPRPVLLTMTPYGIDRNHATAMTLARGGYAVAVADCRGRGDSTGDFDPSFCDAADGFDLVEWLALQPFCDGRVAMWGGSYQGENQWATAAARPPHLAAIAPAAATYMPVDTPWRGPVRMPYMLLWLLLISGRATPFALFTESEIWTAVLQQHYSSDTAFHDLPLSFGKGSRWFDLYLDHPAHDPFWQRLAISPETWAAIDIPVLTITGQYDNAQHGALSYLTQHEMYGTSAAVARHVAVIGPWDHAGTRSGSPVASGVDFGPTGAVDLTALMLGFFDWVLRGGPQPELLRDRVACFDTATGQWHHAPGLRQVTAGRHRLDLGDAEGAAPCRDWLSDPRAPAPGDLLRTPFPEAITENAPPVGLTWLTEPQHGPLELAGWPVLRLWLSTDLPDADIELTLAEIAPDGAVLILGEDRQRLRYRADPMTEVFDHVGPVPIAFNGLPFVARRMQPGTRLRVTLRTVASIHFQRNFQGGGRVDDETIADARAGLIRVWQDADHPMILDLPLARWTPP